MDFGLCKIFVKVLPLKTTAGRYSERRTKARTPREKLTTGGQPSLTASEC